MSAGVGVTPMLAMLGALARATSTRPVWWLYGARNGAEHPFATETRELLSQLPAGRLHVRYSRPRSEDRPVVDHDAVGRVDMDMLRAAGVPLLCGPPALLRELTAALLSWGVDAA